jgi:hypothetical protein
MLIVMADNDMIEVTIIKMTITDFHYMFAKVIEVMIMVGVLDLMILLVVNTNNTKGGGKVTMKVMVVVAVVVIVKL